MSDRQDLRIVKVEPIGSIEDVGAEAAKSMPPGRRYRYRQALSYTTEDGQEFKGEATGMSKPKLAANVGSKASYADQGCFFAMIRDGKFVGSLVKVAIRLG